MSSATSTLAAWWQAARPLAQANIAVPLLFGQALALACGATFWLTGCVVVHGFGLLDHLFIVFANDVADEAGDRRHAAPTHFSGGSRVLPEGKLVARQLAIAAGVAAIGMVAIAMYGELALQRRGMLAGSALAITLLLAYSFGPRLAYRGGGELLQGLGCGVVLPMVGFAAHMGTLEGLPWAALVPAAILGTASNIVTALPDVAADREVDKRTWAVRVGPVAARKHAMLLAATGILATPLVLPTSIGQELLPYQAPGLVLVLLASATWRGAAEGDTRGVTRFVVLMGAAISATLVAWSWALVTIGR
jgi:1,4-dihydroxy-2-naphthoate octaprenyltransferase